MEIMRLRKESYAVVGKDHPKMEADSFSACGRRPTVILMQWHPWQSGMTKEILQVFGAL